MTDLQIWFVISSCCMQYLHLIGSCKRKKREFSFHSFRVLTTLIANRKKRRQLHIIIVSLLKISNKSGREAQEGLSITIGGTYRCSHVLTLLQLILPQTLLLDPLSKLLSICLVKSEEYSLICSYSQSCPS